MYFVKCQLKDDKHKVTCSQYKRANGTDSSQNKHLLKRKRKYFPQNLLSRGIWGSPSEEMRLQVSHN